ncbi:hypothetical protein [Mucilaginibacter paludis]|uniref:Heat shock protein DnaJ domain protein n=1 Tax=Mucilaginibacter paludis DSM 18603 TaxID=714943 RepID=H1YDL6_9SPHI|nr:hypothetical protein [Mucilaginibacter paludis]EHQ30705.1 heat shock protein DnaJ domain protein [Mucilaginibacter paludis DSM 18603]
MKTFNLICLSIILTCIYAGCVNNTKNAETSKPPVPKVIQGDFNGDGKPEIVRLVKPKLNKEGTDCVGGCVSYLRFSDTTIADIKVNNCIDGTPDNLGDLNGDGKDEIGLLPEWFTSCWRSYLVYTYKNDKWIYAVPPITTHCNQWEAHIKPIEKDSLNKGYVVIRYSESENNEIVNKSKIIAIK